MSLTLTAAKQYILRPVGGRDNTDAQTEAGEALAAAMEWFTNDHDWHFLLEDTGRSFTVADCDPTVGTTLTTNTTNGFKNVLVGMTVSGTDITAGSKVASITSTTSIELDTAATGTTNGTITFGGTIPIIAGTDTYTLPSRFWKPYSCRLTSAVYQPLRYVRQAEWDAITGQQTTQGSVFAYTTYDGTTFDASGTQQSKIKFFRPPNQADVALLKYYRWMDPAADPIDCHDRYQYALLMQARVELLRNRNATDQRIPIWEAKAEERLRRAIANDFEEGGPDYLPRMRTMDEVDKGGVLSGDFYPRGDRVFPYA